MTRPPRSASSRPSAPNSKPASRPWPPACARAAHGDARVRDLIAELLWFHQRSQKPGWWALFERQAWSEDELVDDAESLGGLQLDTRDAAGSGQEVVRHRLRLSAAGHQAQGRRYTADCRNARLCGQDRRDFRRGRQGRAAPWHEIGRHARTLQPRSGADQSANTCPTR